MAAYFAPPFWMIQGRFANVSTLFTTVGFLNKPSTTGNGGRTLTSGRCPSIDESKAVSSPQI